MPAIRGNDYAKGNPGGGAPEGNQNAVGNDGGAPEGNRNAVKHGGWADPLKHYKRLKDGTLADDPFKAREWIDWHVAEYVQDYALVHGMSTEAVRADGDVMDRLRALAAMEDLEMRAAAEELLTPTVEREVEHEFPDGETRTCTTETVNPAGWASLRLSQRHRNERKRLGIDPRSVRREREFHEQISDAGLKRIREWKGSKDGSRPDTPHSE